MILLLPDPFPKSIILSPVPGELLNRTTAPTVKPPLDDMLNSHRPAETHTSTCGRCSSASCWPRTPGTASRWPASSPTSTAACCRPRTASSSAQLPPRRRQGHGPAAAHCVAAQSQVTLHHSAVGELHQLQITTDVFASISRKKVREKMVAFKDVFFNDIYCLGGCIL